jgi:hypothetical protein
MSDVLTFERVLCEVCVGPAMVRPANVGMIAMIRRCGVQPSTGGDGWFELTPAEARELAAHLIKTADEAERVT